MSLISGSNSCFAAGAATSLLSADIVEKLVEAGRTSLLVICLRKSALNESARGRGVPRKDRWRGRNALRLAVRARDISDSTEWYGAGETGQLVLLARLEVEQKRLF